MFRFDGGIPVLYDASWVTRGRETNWEGNWRLECEEGVVTLREGVVHVVEGPKSATDIQVELHALPCEGQAHALMEFQDAIRQNREPEANAADNLRSLGMVFATLESVRSGGPAPI